MSWLETLLKQSVERGDAPGIAAVAGDIEGVTHQAAFGLAEGTAPVDLETTVFWVASMTKPVTAIAALQLVEQGRLDLDAPLAELRPEIADRQILTGWDDAGDAQLRPATTAITLRQLLVHTAGYGYEFWNADVAAYQEKNDIPPVAACRKINLQNPLVREPGSDWEYGPNIEWVGLAVEAASGQNLEQYLRANVLDPLGLTNTGFVLNDPSRLAGMNARTSDGRTAPLDLRLPAEPEYYLGGGGLYSTASEFLRFLRAILRDGELDGVRLLSAETMQEAKRNQLGDLRVRRLTTTNSTVSQDLDPDAGVERSWSLLGMRNEEVTPEGRSVGSLFWAGLTNCFFWVDWTNGDAGALFSQYLPFAEDRIMNLFHGFERGVHTGQR